MKVFTQVVSGACVDDISGSHFLTELAEVAQCFEVFGVKGGCGFDFDTDQVASGLDKEINLVSFTLSPDMHVLWPG